MNRMLTWLSLFTSSGTLICCALPSLFVALGMGATLAGFVGTVPQIVWLSKYKTIVFLVSGSLLFIAAVLQYRARNEPCPADPKLADLCDRNRRWSKVILIISTGLWIVGAFFAFIAPRIL